MPAATKAPVESVIHALSVRDLGVSGVAGRAHVSRAKATEILGTFEYIGIVKKGQISIRSGPGRENIEWQSIYHLRSDQNDLSRVQPRRYCTC